MAAGFDFVVGRVSISIESSIGNYDYESIADTLNNEKEFYHKLHINT